MIRAQRSVLYGILWISSMVFLGAGVSVAQQPYPSRPIRMLVPYPPGGPTDLLARSLGAAFAERGGQPMVIENRPGANTNIATEICAKSPADGYTICLISSTVSLNPFLYSKMPYDAEKDLEPVTNLVFAPEVLISGTTIPVNSFQDLVAYSKANPGRLNYGSFGLGGTPHLIAEWLKKTTGADWTHVPYKGAALALQAMASGEIHLMYLAIGSPGVVPQIKAGKLKGLLVQGSKRHPLLPEVPAFTEAGLPEYVMRTWFGLAAPAGTPRDVVRKLSAESSAIVRSPAFRERLATFGFEPAGNTPEEFARFLAEDRVRGANLVKLSGARLE